MQKLVVFGSKYGSTAEYARAIAGGLGCAAIPAADALADPYHIGSADMLVLGTPIYYDDVHPEVKALLTGYRNVLSHRIIALFVVCLDPSERAKKNEQHCNPDNLKSVAAMLSTYPVAATLLPGRIIMDELDEEDSRKTADFYKKIGLPLQDHDRFDLDSVKPFVEQLMVFK